MSQKAYLLVLLSLVTSNIYMTESYTLTASDLTQMGYNNQSITVSLNDDNVDSIHPNALNGYGNLKVFILLSKNLLTIDLEIFKDALNLDKIWLNVPSLNKFTNSKNIKLAYVLDLYLTSNLTSLNKAMFNAFPSLRTFSTEQLSPTGSIKTIDVHTFESLSNLETIDIAYNLITSFEYLQIPKKCLLLVLAHNRMNYFALSRTMGFLEYLDISYNLFRSFKSMDFTFLANLTQLKLSYNPHAYPYEIAGHLKPLSKLRRVEIANLSIITIDSNYFRNNTKLQYIDLKDNNISSLDYRAFNGLNDLQTILLRYNNLGKISSGTFNNPNLQLVDLAYNQISQIDNLTFYGGSSNIYYGLDVSLTNNKLTKILPRTFINAYRSISLLYNQITEIDNSMFDGAIEIRNLYLSNNKIEKIAPGSFKNIGSGDLDLSYNKLTELRNMTFVGKIGSLRVLDNRIERIEEGAFNYATFTERIDLSYNSLTEINATMFAGQNQIKEIYLNNNKLSKIESGSFANLPNLKYVYLDYNQLTQLDSSMFAGSNNLNAIYLSSNPSLSTANIQRLCSPAATNCHVYY